jgi:hypothetical protein
MPPVRITPVASKLIPKDVWPLVGLVSIVLCFGTYKGIEHLSVRERARGRTEGVSVDGSPSSPSTTTTPYALARTAHPSQNPDVQLNPAKRSTVPWEKEGSEESGEAWHRE